MGTTLACSAASRASAPRRTGVLTLSTRSSSAGVVLQAEAQPRADQRLLAGGGLLHLQPDPVAAASCHRLGRRQDQPSEPVTMGPVQGRIRPTGERVVLRTVEGGGPGQVVAGGGPGAARQAGQDQGQAQQDGDGHGQQPRDPASGGRIPVTGEAAVPGAMT